MSEAARSQTSDGEAFPTYRDAKAEVLEAFHKRYFGRLMKRHNSLSAAAEEAGMDRKHLRIMLRRCGLWSR
jgi:hypothetical protein